MCANIIISALWLLQTAYILYIQANYLSHSVKAAVTNDTVNHLEMTTRQIFSQRDNLNNAVYASNPCQRTAIHET